MNIYNKLRKCVKKEIIAFSNYQSYNKIPYENHHNWTDRPVIHIGILDFVLFPDAPEFYASYQMLNIKNHYLFNDKFALNVLSLRETELATEEDKLWQIDTWAKLFAAKTWRDIKMIAQNNEILSSATKSLFEYNADDLIRQQCRAREEAERHERTMQKKLADSAKTIAELTETISQQKHTINELKLDNQKLHTENSDLKINIQNLYHTNSKLENDMKNLHSIVLSLQNQLTTASKV